MQLNFALTTDLKEQHSCFRCNAFIGLEDEHFKIQIRSRQERACFSCLNRLREDLGLKAFTRCKCCDRILLTCEDFCPQCSEIPEIGEEEGE